MAEAALTDTAYWADYWQLRPPTRIPERWFYAELLRATIAGRGYRSIVEFGGFPGSFGVYARRYLGFTDLAILDSYVDYAYLDAFLSANEMTNSDVDVFEGDLFDYTLPRTFDVVLSGGLLEHFDDPRAALERHVRALSPGGTLVVTVPNFRGLNGLLQRVFNSEDLAHHNLQLMRPEALRAAVAGTAGLFGVRGFYYGPFRAWLERRPPVIGAASLFLVRGTGVVLDAIRPRTQLTARDVVAVGIKQ